MVQKFPVMLLEILETVEYIRNANHSSENSGKRAHGMITYDCKKDHCSNVRIVRFLIARLLTDYGR